MRSHCLCEGWAALRVDDDDGLLAGRCLDEQLQERRFSRARSPEESAVSGQLAEAQVDRADGALVANTDAAAGMTDATSFVHAGERSTQADAMLARARRLLSDHRARAKRHGATLDYTLAGARQLLESSPCCFYCNLPLAWNAQLDHRTPIRRGGRHAFNNLAVCCPRCNTTTTPSPMPVSRRRSSSPLPPTARKPAHSSGSRP